MGNTQSGQHVFLEKDIEWESFQSSTEWRSARAKELDKLGGSMRPCVGRGGSFTAKMEFLGNAVHSQGDRLQHILSVPATKKKEEEHKKNSAFLLNTDKRALERRGEMADSSALGFASVTHSPHQSSGGAERGQDAPLGAVAADDSERANDSAVEGRLVPTTRANDSIDSRNDACFLTTAPSEATPTAVARNASIRGNRGDQFPDGGSEGGMGRAAERNASTRLRNNGIGEGSSEGAMGSAPDGGSESGVGRGVAQAASHARHASSRLKGNSNNGGEESPTANRLLRNQTTRKRAPLADGPPPAPPPPPVAEWRKRVHRARRNVMITVLTMVRLKRGMKHPHRLPRLDDLSIFVPIMLGNDVMKKFVTEQRRYRQISDSTDKLRAELEDALRPPDVLITSRIEPDHHGLAAPEPSQTPHQAAHQAAPDIISNSLARSSASEPPLPSENDDRLAVPGQHATTSYLATSPLNIPGAERHLDYSLSSPGPLQARSPYPVPRAPMSPGPEGSPGKHSQLPPIPWVPASPIGRGAPGAERVSALGQSKSSGHEDRSSPARLSLTPLEPLAKASMEAAASKVCKSSVEDLLNKMPMGKLTAASVPVNRKDGNSRRWRMAGKASLNAIRHHSGSGVLPSLRSNTVQPLRVHSHSGTSSQQPARDNRSSSAKKAHPLRSISNEDADIVAPLVPRFASGSGRVPSQSARTGQANPWSRPLLGPSVSCNGRTEQHRSSFEEATLVKRLSDPRPNAPHISSSGEGEGVADVEEEDPYQGMTPRTRTQALDKKLEEETEALKRSGQLLSMYVNRCNSSWADSQQWEAPDVMHAVEFDAWLRGDVYTTYKVEAQRKLWQGAVALQLFAADDYFTNAKGETQDVWCADPWALVDTCRPGIMPSTDRVEGVPMGPRCMCHVILALTDQIGPEAVRNLSVVLHINEDQELEVTQDFWKHQFYGLQRSNVIFLVQRRHPGYRYSWDEKLFTAAEDHANVQSMGSGHCIAQMAWASEAFMISEEGLHEPLLIPTIEHLLQKKVEWVVSRRCRDLALYSRSTCSAMDLQSLSYCMHQRASSHANMVMEVQQVKTVGAARQYDSIVLQHARQTGAASSSSSINLNGNSAANHDKASKAVIGLSQSLTLAELRHSELNTPKMIKVIEGLRHEGRGTFPVGLNRCTYHLQSMKALLTSFAVFRPKLLLQKELLHVSLDLADLTAADKARCVAMEARHVPGMLLNPHSLDVLMPMIQAQDHDIDFRERVMNHAGSHVSTAAIVSGREHSSAEGPHHTIVVFVVNNHVSSIAVHMAACLAKPGRDVIRLVTFVPLESQKAEAESLLKSHAKGVVMRSMTDTHCDAVVRGQLGLLDCMEKYVLQLGVTSMTVVMGSAQLTSNVFDYVVGSVTLSAIKRLVGVPVVVVTANSKNISGIQPGQGFRSMVQVEGHSREMLGHMCSKLIDVNRGDKLILSQVLATCHLTRQQQVNSRRLVENFHSICHGLMVPVAKTNRVEGQYEQLLTEMVEEDSISLLGVQLPPGKKSLPVPMLSLLRSSRGATLVYHDAGDRGLLRRAQDVPTP